MIQITNKSETYLPNIFIGKYPPKATHSPIKMLINTSFLMSLKLEILSFQYCFVNIIIKKDLPQRSANSTAEV